MIHKNQKGIYYIKARFYWAGKQREVQVGSIPIVVDIINTMIKHNIFTTINHIKTNNITWEQVNKNPDIVDAIKVVASLKAQEYILRRLFSKNTSQDARQSEKSERNNKFDPEHIPNDEIIEKPKLDEDDLEGIKWYERWREENL